MLTDKITTTEGAIGQIGDGATIMVGGFGVPGTPFCLIDELVRQGQKRLTVIKNDANETGMGIDHLLENGQVEKMIVTHIGLNPRAIQMMNENVLEVEFCAQGMLAERIRAAGAGLIGFLTDIGIETKLAEGKTVLNFEGHSTLIEKSLRADFALLHTHRADPFGNLIYAASAQNFNPLMAMAADKVLVEVEELLSLGDLSPNTIHTPGPFVDCVIPLPELTKEYDVVQR